MDRKHKRLSLKELKSQVFVVPSYYWLTYSSTARQSTATNLKRYLVQQLRARETVKGRMQRLVRPSSYINHTPMLGRMMAQITKKQDIQNLVGSDSRKYVPIFDEIMPEDIAM